MRGIMDNSTNSNLPNEQKWTLRYLETELDELKREQVHISKKRQERDLSNWENDRLDRILTEIADILGEIEKSSGAYRVKAA